MGVLAALYSFTYRGYEHISALFPELRNEDSVYVPSRGFPFAQWAINGPRQSGFGVERSAFLPSGILGNIVVYSFLTFLVAVPTWLLACLILYLRRHRAPVSSHHIDSQKLR